MSSNPFEIVDPFLKEKEKVEQIKKEVFIKTFIEIIKDKDRKAPFSGIKSQFFPL